MLRNSERQTGHQVVKKNKNTGRPWSDSWAAFHVVPSNSVNPNCGKVWPTSVPSPGWSMIIAALAGAEAGTDAGPVVGSAGAVVSGAWVEPGSVPDIAIDVGSGKAVIAERVAGPDESVGAATGAESDAASTVDAGVEAGRASVAEVPQANIPITTAINGRASSRDIPDYPRSSVRLDG